MLATVEPKRQLARFRGRSYVAFVFSPVVPIVGWLEEVDATLAHSPGFFVGRPVVLDLSAVDLSPSAITHLISSLETRNIRILGIEGVDEAHLNPGLPPLLTGGRQCVLEQHAPKPEAKPQPQPTSLLIATPVRSGQSIVFAEGDVTVLGDGRRQRQFGRADLLPEDRSRTSGDRRLLPDRGRHQRDSAQSTDSGVA
jgi:septum site-determining protein MinC